MPNNAVNIVTRAFNTPLLLDPAKAAVIAPVLAQRLPGFTQGAQIEVAGQFDAPSEAHRQPRPQAASIIGDELHRNVVRRGGGYSVIQGVAVISVVGSLVRRGSYVGASSGVTSYEGLSAQVRAAAEDEEVKVIALEIDSFGGEADGIFDLGAQIRAARSIKPVHAFLADHALSAGYAIASQADTITVPPFGYAGSIGVVSMHADFSGQLDKAGVTVTLVHSGAHKVDGNPYAPLADGVRAQMQKENDAVWSAFAEMVEQGRRGRISMADALKTEAAIFRGQVAVDIGLADQVAEARAGFAALVAEVNPNVAPVGMVGAAAPRPGSMADCADTGRQAISLIRPVPLTASTANDFLDALQTKAGELITGSSGCDNGAGAPQRKEPEMAKDEKKPVAEVQTANDAQAANASANPVGSEAAVQAAMDAERTRCSKITAKVQKAGLPASFAQKLIDDKTSYADALEQIVDAKADRAMDGGDIVNTSGAAMITHDGRDKMREGMTAALLGKANMKGGANNEFTSMTLREMARSCLIGQGASVPSGGVMQLASAAFAPATAGAMHSTSDFGNILADVANKSMLKGFGESPEVFERFTSVGTMSDFKPHKRVGMDEFPALLEVAEGAEFKYGSMGDHAETALLATYGRMFAITRQTIINDDLDAFTKIPGRMGRAARRTVGDLVFAVLSANANMSDGVALFHADHGNLAASGAGPSEATINAGITAMAVQTDRGGNATLNVNPAFLLAPPKWRAPVLQALNSEYAPDDTSKAGTAKMSRAYNTVRDAAEPLFDARLTGDAWYLLADPNVNDTIEVGYLDGVSTPFLDQQDGWSVDGTEFKVRIDAVANANAWQGLYKDAGS